MPSETKLTPEKALALIKQRLSADLTQAAVAKGDAAIADWFASTAETKKQFGPNVSLLRTDLEQLVEAIRFALDASDGTITF